MKRFQTWLQTESPDRGPYQPAEPAALVRVGRRLEPEDVIDILNELDRTSEARDALPAWDGDSSDDIAFWQEHMAGMLAATHGPARAALLADRAERNPLTRRYVEIALSAPEV